MLQQPTCTMQAATLDIPSTAPLKWDICSLLAARPPCTTFHTRRCHHRNMDGRPICFCVHIQFQSVGLQFMSVFWVTFEYVMKKKGSLKVHQVEKVQECVSYPRISENFTPIVDRRNLCRCRGIKGKKITNRPAWIIRRF